MEMQTVKMCDSRHSGRKSKSGDTSRTEENQDSASNNDALLYRCNWVYNSIDL
jgi:hypothetical protein